MAMLQLSSYLQKITNNVYNIAFGGRKKDAVYQITSFHRFI